MQVKYIKQRYVDLYDDPDPQDIQIQLKQQRQSKPKNSAKKLNASMNISRVTKVNPQVNTFLAVNELKKSQQQIDGLKRRLSYLKVHQDRNIQKVHINQKKIDRHYHAQQDAAKDKIRNMRYLAALRKQMQQQRQANSLQKMQREKKIREAKQKLLSSHQKDVQITKKMSQQIARNITIMKNLELAQKKQRRDLIAEMEQKNKQSVKLKISHKLNDIHISRAIETSRFKQKNIQKELYMIELNRLETEMIQRQSKSKMTEKCQKINTENISKLACIRKNLGAVTRYFLQKWQKYYKHSDTLMQSVHDPKGMI